MSSEDEVKSILESFGMPEDVISQFKAHGIDKAVFDDLSDWEISQIIPNLVGLRHRFKANYDRYIQNLKTQNKSLDSNNILPSLLLPEDVSVVEIIPRVEDIEYDHPPLKRIKINEVEHILESTFDGKCLLSSHKINSTFTDNERNKLSELVIHYILSPDPSKKILYSDLDCFASEIVALFPGELKEVYYVPYRKEGKVITLAKGKLIEKYHNTRRKGIKSGLIPAKSTGRDNTPQTKLERTDAECDSNDDILWLNSYTEPWQQVETRWESTFTERVHEMQNDDGAKTVHTYMLRYPALRKPLGYTLLERDFALMFDGKELKLVRELPKFCAKLETKLKQAKPTVFANYKFQDDQGLKLLLHLSEIFRPHNVRVSQKIQWRPSKVEMQDGFLSHIAVIGDLKSIIERKKKKYEAFTQTMQPFVIVVGQDTSDITSSYVYIDDMYELESPIKAIDICFKAFHAVHAIYPLESAPLWMLMQKCIYNIDTKWDKTYSSVNALLPFFKDS